MEILPVGKGVGEVSSAGKEAMYFKLLICNVLPSLLDKVSILIHVVF